MGKGNPYAYKNSNWTKGESANPGGVPSGLTVYKRALKELCREELTLLFSHFSRMSAPELKAVIDDPRTTCKDHAIAVAVAKWSLTGEIDIVNKYIDLIYGDSKKAGEIASRKSDSGSNKEIEKKPDDFVLSFDPSMKDV